MNTMLAPGLALGLAFLPLGVGALEARVEARNGVPALIVNGEPVPPFMLFHTAGGGATALSCEVEPEWRAFSYTFRAPCNDNKVGLHINCVSPKGDWLVDDARFFEGTLAQPKSANLLVGGDFEGDEPPLPWVYFLNDSTGAAADYSLEHKGAHAGRSCLRVRIASPGTADYHIHIYQLVRIEKGKTYTFSVWLRASDKRTITMKAVHQAPPWTVYGGDTSASDRILALGAERGLHIGTPPVSLPWARDGGTADFSAADTQVEHILSVDPSALVIPRIHLDAPGWWKQAHPGHRQVYDKGEYPMASPASRPWRRDASAALRQFIRHLEAKYGEHMLGYHVTAQSAGEWFYDHTWEKIMPCFEEPFRRAFAEWARNKYVSVERLREAWRQTDVTFGTVRVPTLEERTTGRLGAFRDPERQQFEIDFAEYMQVCLCEYLEECARLVKEETGGKKLGVFFYGYLFDVAGFAYGGAVSGHLRLRRALDSPHVDVFCSPISYFDRQAGGCGPFMSAVDSIQAHGKLWINEDDTRTHLAPAGAGFGRTSTMAETLGVYRRNFGHQFERRCGTWYMDFGTGWMADSAIFDNFAAVRDVWAAAPAGGPFAPEVAVIIDEDSALYLRHSNEITLHAVNRVRHELNTMGCPVGLYLMQDVCEGRLPESVRLYVFLNAYRVTAEQRRLLRMQVARGGKSVLWLYAPGYIRERASPENIADLTGIGVTLLEASVSARVKVVEAPPTLLDGLASGHAFGPDVRPRPLFAVSPGQDEATALGHYSGSDHVALAMRCFPEWTSLFCGGLGVSADLLRKLAVAAGAHVYCDSNDVVSASPGFVSIHATSTGDKALLLPRPARLRDLIDGRVLAPLRKRHSFSMQKGETRLFAIIE